MKKFLLATDRQYDDTYVSYTPEQITLNLEAYVIYGEAIIVSWDDTVGSIKMNNFEIPATAISSEEELKANIIAKLNDGGFGCKEIKGAFVEIMARYTGYADAKAHVTEFFVEKPGQKLSAKEKELAYDSYLYT
jgi:hypothetical protein